MRGFCNSQSSIVALIRNYSIVNVQDYCIDGDTVDSLNDYTADDSLNKATLADKDNSSPQSYP